MIPLTTLHETLSRWIEVVPVNRDRAYDVATVAWLTACMLQQHVQASHDALEAERVADVARALHNVEREMHWLQLYGHTADEFDISHRVVKALLNARHATALLQHHEYQRPRPES